MSVEKKRVRARFREAVFARDGYRCRVCGQVGPNGVGLDAHHITDRNLLPKGGYVAENGISLCAPCHEKAEVFHRTGTALPGWAPDDLYARVGSSPSAALAAAKRL